MKEGAKWEKYANKKKKKKKGNTSRDISKILSVVQEYFRSALKEREREAGRFHDS